jgi:hypothetical protein
MASAHADYHDRGVTVMMLSVGDEDPETVRVWMERHGGKDLMYGYANTATAEQAHTVAGREFRFIPATVFISASGRVSDVLGGHDEEAFQQSLKRIVPK